jgi:hypothetical protein
MRHYDPPVAGDGPLWNRYAAISDLIQRLADHCEKLTLAVVGSADRLGWNATYTGYFQKRA